MLFYKRGPQWKHLWCIRLVSVYEWVEEKASKLHPQQAPPEDLFREGIKTTSPTGSSWRPLSIAYFDSLLLIFGFIGICLQLVLVFPDVDIVLFCSGHTYEMYSGGGSSTYVCGVALLSCDSSPKCKKCWLSLCIPLHSLMLMIRNTPGLWAVFVSQSFPLGVWACTVQW